MIIIRIIVGALEGFISHDAATREATIEAFAHDLGVSKRTVEQALRKLRYWKAKPVLVCT
jgi:DNA-binding transcriptional ArsR family regulator